MELATGACIAHISAYTCRELSWLLITTPARHGKRRTKKLAEPQGEQITLAFQQTYEFKSNINLEIVARGLTNLMHQR